MNIFYLDRDPKTAAKAHVDKHVVKMCVEYAQLLSTAQHLQGNPSKDIYKLTHAKHPSALWVRKSLDNYQWLYDLYVYTGEEYTYRYGKVHASLELKELLAKKPPSSKSKGFTKMALAMPDEFKIHKDPVDCYREYYRLGKSQLHTWTKRKKPEWI